MSSSLYYRLIKDGTLLSDELKRILKKSLLNDKSTVILNRNHISYLEGIRDSVGKEDNIYKDVEKIIDLIENGADIELYIEY